MSEANPIVRPGFLRALAMVTIVFGALLYQNWTLVVTPFEGQLRAELSRRAQQQRFLKQLRDDPEVGAKLPEIVVPRKETKKTQVIVFGGPLSACCSGKPIALASSLARQIGKENQEADIVLVLDGPPDAVDDYIRHRKLVFPVVADDGRLAKAFNAFWTPRVYVYANERVRWLQRSEALNTSSLHHAVSETQ